MKFADEGAPAAFRAWKNLAAGGGSPLEPWMSYYWDGSYGTNSWIYYQASSTGQNAYFWKNANVKNPNEIPVLLDSYSFGGRARHDDPPPEFDGDVINAARDGYFTKQFCINRHNGSVNAVFMDFSARPVGLKELWTLRWSRTYNTCYKYTMCGNNGKPSTKFPDWMKGFKDY
jgi:prepilin-type processing-associated H-X9-DG protein